MKRKTAKKAPVTFVVSNSFHRLTLIPGTAEVKFDEDEAGQPVAYATVDKAWQKAQVGARYANLDLVGMLVTVPDWFDVVHPMNDTRQGGRIIWAHEPDV